MINTIYSIIGTLGFCAILNVPYKKIVWVLFGCTISATTFEYLYSVKNFTIFISTLIAAILIGIYSEIIARIVKTPATVILVPSTIPLLPGGTLYYSMSYLVHSNFKMFTIYAMDTINTAFGIAMGAIITSIMVKIFYHNKKHKNS